MVFLLKLLLYKLQPEVICYHTGEITSLSAVIFDIDHIKKVNYSYGHESGNTTLIKLARILEKYVEQYETLARYGGEEFVLLLVGCTKVEAIDRAELCRRFRCEKCGECCLKAVHTVFFCS